MLSWGRGWHDALRDGAGDAVLQVAEAVGEARSYAALSNGASVQAVTVAGSLDAGQRRSRQVQDVCYLGGLEVGAVEVGGAADLEQSPVGWVRPTRS